MKNADLINKYGNMARYHAITALLPKTLAAIGSYAAYMARYAAGPFWDIADRRDATSAAELLDMLAEGWRRCLEYFEGFDPMILDLMAARITLKLEDDGEEGGAE